MYKNNEEVIKSYRRKRVGLSSKVRSGLQQFYITTESSSSLETSFRSTITKAVHTKRYNLHTKWTQATFQSGLQSFGYRQIGNCGQLRQKKTLQCLLINFKADPPCIQKNVSEQTLSSFHFSLMSPCMLLYTRGTVAQKRRDSLAVVYSLHFFAPTIPTYQHECFSVHTRTRWWYTLLQK